jgi:hypothetical protein
MAIKKPLVLKGFDAKKLFTSFLSLWHLLNLYEPGA